MPIAYSQTLGANTYTSRLTAFLRAAEDSIPRPYVDTVGVPTIGWGFALNDRNGIPQGRTHVIQDVLGVNPNRPGLSPEARARETAYRGQLITALNQARAGDNTTTQTGASSNALRADLNAILAARAVDIAANYAQADRDLIGAPSTVFEYANVDQMEATFLRMKPEYDRRLRLGLQSNPPETNERIALFTVAFHGSLHPRSAFTISLRNALAMADPNDARAQAWYVLRYTRAAAFARRSYLESGMFGLYDVQEPMSEAVARGVYRMYSRNADRMVQWDAGTANRVVLADAGRVLAGLAIPGASAAALEPSLQPAANQLIAQFGQGRAFSALNVRVAAAAGSTITGHATAADLMLGDAGADKLVGRGGADVMIGFGGNDTYVVDGADLIIDDGGRVEDRNGQLIAGLWADRGDGVYRWVQTPAASATTNSPLTVTLTDGSTFTVQNFVNGDFGIRLVNDATPIDPVTTRPINGDLAPQDFDAAAGVQTRTDELGNVIVTAAAEPDRVDTLYGSADADRIIAGGGNDIISTARGGSDWIDAGAGQDFAAGGDGDDRIQGGVGSDYLKGDAGKDLIESGADSDVVLGGAGDDRLYANAYTTLADAWAQSEASGTGLISGLTNGGEGDDILVGVAGDDVLMGGGGADVIVAGAGGDTVWGDLDATPLNIGWQLLIQPETALYADIPMLPQVQRRGVQLLSEFDATPASSGDDVIYLGGGDDWTMTGPGDDLVFADSGNDFALGELGDDTLIGGVGNDWLGGDAQYLAVAGLGGADFLDGGLGNDVLVGEAGSDTLFGGDGNDFLAGDADASIPLFAQGADILNGDGGADTLLGGGGDDILVGGRDNDTLKGGAGDDVYVFNAGDGADVIVDKEGAANVIRFGDTVLETAITARQDGADRLLITYGALDSISVESGLTAALASIEVAGVAHDLQTFLTRFATTGVVLNADTLTNLPAGAFEIHGGGFGDTLSAGSKDAFKLVGGGGADTLTVTTNVASTTHVEFGSGDGADRVRGVGIKQFHFDDGVDPLSVTATRIGATDPNRVTARDIVLTYAAVPPYSVDVLDTIAVEDTANSINTRYSFADGSSLSHVELLERSNLELDWLGGAGDEFVSATILNDRLVGGGGGDNLEGRDGNDTLDGGAGFDTLRGEAGNDSLIGGADRDTLEGGVGNDSLIGGTGNDVLDGGAGNDIYSFVAGDGIDVVIDNAGDTVVEFGTGVAFANVTAELINGTDGNIYLAVRSSPTDLVLVRQSFGLAAADGAVSFKVAGVSYTGEDFASQKLPQALNFRGEHSSVRVTGSRFDDTIIGSTRDDRLEGGAGNDRLAGDAGRDTLIGGAGTDLLIGNAGDDTLDGGAGADTYRMHRGMGKDLVIEQGTDLNVLLLDAGLTTADLARERSGDDLYLHLRNSRDGVHIRNYFVPGSTTNAQNWQVTLSNGTGTALQSLVGTLPTTVVPAGVAALIADFKVRAQTFYEAALVTGGYIRQSDGRYVRDFSTSRDTYSSRTITTVGIALPTQVGDATSMTRDTEGLQRLSRTWTPTQTSHTFQELNTNGGTRVSFGGGGNRPSLGGNSGSNSYFDWNTYNGRQYDGIIIPTVGDTTPWDPITGFPIPDDTGYYTYPTPPTYTTRTVTRFHDHVVEEYRLNILDMTAGASNNVISASEYATIDGGAGDDQITATIGFQANYVYVPEVAMNRAGEPGVLLYGNAGNDYLTGSSSDDVLIGGAGIDTMSGGGGNDVYVVLAGSGIDEIIEDGATDPGIAGEDVLRLPTGVTRAALRFAWTQELRGEHFHGFTPSPFKSLYAVLTVTWGTSDGAKLVIPHVEAGVGTGIDLIEFADGSRMSFSEILAIAPAELNPHHLANTLSGPGIIAGGPGNDTVTAQIAIGNAGRDTLIGTAGDDELYGGDQLAQILVSSPSIGTLWDEGSTFRPGKGNDYMWATAGSDTFEFAALDGMDTVIDLQHDSLHWYYGGSLTHLVGELDIEAVDPGHRATLLANTDTLAFGTGIIPDDIEVVRMTAPSHGDGPFDYLVFRHKNGADSVRFANWFFPEIHNQLSRVTFIGGEVWDSSKIAVLATGAKRLERGSDSDDFITGSVLDEILRGAGGADFLEGGQGNDVLDGGAGNDTYFFSPGDGVDTISDSGLNTIDVLEFGAGVTSQSLTLGLGSLLIRVGQGGDAIHVEGFDPNNALGSTPIDSVRFADGSTLTYAQLLARGFDLNGTSGDETLTGTNLTDRINGFEGTDVLLGGAGDDTYAFGSGSGNDRIEDSAGTLDTVKLAAGITQGQVTVTRAGNMLTLAFAGISDKLTIRQETGAFRIERVLFADGSSWDAATLESKVPVTNTAPVVASAIPDLAANEDALLSYVVPATTFSDPGDTLTYSATLSTGAALPTWLAFNATTRTFSGTPLNANVGAIDVNVRATDTGALSATDTFRITVANVNDAPVVAAAIPDLTANEDAAFSYVVPAATFTDVDVGATLAYAATLSTGAALPSWLTFTAATRTFSGTPLNANVGAIDVSVRATDNVGASVTDTFRVTVANVNDAPVLSTLIPDLTTNEDAAFNYVVPAGTFTDIDPGATLTYAATLSTGAALPSWLTFTAATRTFSGTPLNANVGALDLNVRATDVAGASATDTFRITVANVNDAPAVAAAVPDQTATEDVAFSYVVPAATFTDVDVGATLTYSATLSTGAALPAWLTFAAATRTFSGTPLNANVGAIDVNVRATDNVGASGTDTFRITVANVNDAPVVSAAIPDLITNKDQAFSYVVPASTFTDVDPGATLAYTATLSTGAALPAWLTFNATTRTFSGTPLAADVGAIDVNVRATDVAAASATDTFRLTVANVTAPVVSVPVPDLGATEDLAFSYVVPAGTFTDSDAGASLTYSATLSTGAALPAWLTFAAASRTFSGTPLNANVGPMDVNVRATDNTGLSATDTFRITVANTNDAPVVAAAIPDAAATEDTAFSYVVPAATFTDVDAGATLTYSATLSTGAALPSWLTFAAATRTFSGTPLNANVGAIDVNVRATDNAGAAATDTFRITVANVNDAPVVSAAIPDLIATKDQAFSYVVPAATFTDVDPGATLTYAATLGTGAALPAWLTFNATTRTFSGTPLAADVGAVDVNVRATDNAGASVTDTFRMTVAVATAPVVSAPIPDLASNEDQAFSYVVPAGTFTDADPGTTLTYSATLSTGAALPAWLTFTAASRTFSGTPLNANVGPIDVNVRATDNTGLSATDTFRITVANTNDAPVVAAAIPDVAATEDTAFSYVVPAGTFTDVDAGATLTYSATLSTGAALPGWLAFTAATRTFSGTPLNANVGAIDVNVRATDNVGAAATDTFRITVANVNDAPVVSAAIPDLTTNEDQALSYVVPVGTFTDMDPGATLTYSATLSSGAALPSWLAFNATTRAFTGTPLNANVGAIDLNVRAADVAGASATDTFRITVANVNDAPVVAAPIPDTTAVERQAFSYVVPAGTFTDVDAGATLTYGATLSSGAALPAWLTFTAATRTLAGTPGEYDVGGLTVRVSATDNVGAKANDDFLLTVGPLAGVTQTGTVGNDTFNGTDGADHFTGLAGADTAYGMRGHDTFFGNEGADIGWGGTGNDTLYGGAGDDVLGGDEGDDSVFGEGEHDHLWGDVGNDILDGGLGDDELGGDEGHDWLRGGDGIDALYGGLGNDLLQGGIGNDDMDGEGDNDILQGMDGNDTMWDTIGNNLLHGGAGIDELGGGAGRELFIGGAGNDGIVRGTGADIVAFNRGDGADILYGETGADDTLSLGGGIRYADMRFTKSGTDLVLGLGGTDSITIEAWYTGTTNKSVLNMQVIVDAMADFNAASTDPLVNRKVANFNFAGLASAFDAAGAPAGWALTDALLSKHLSGSDTAALGADLTYRYGRTGSLANIGFDPAVGILSGGSFGTSAQALQSAAVLESGAKRLV